MSGTPIKTPHQHKLEGTKPKYMSKSRDALLEAIALSPPAINPYMPAPPELTGKGIETWQDIVQTLANIGSLSLIDVPLLTAYCHSVEQYFDVTRKLNEQGLDGYIEDTQMGSKLSTLARIQQVHLDNMLKLGRDFGATIASRTKAIANIVNDNTKNKKSKFFND